MFSIRMLEKIGHPFSKITTPMEKQFLKYRSNIIGINQKIAIPNQKKRKITYADWAASGRCYRLIEDDIRNNVMPFFANTHTESSETGRITSLLYSRAKDVIKKHVNADERHVLISSGSGMTDVVNKFQRILGLKPNGHNQSWLPDTSDKPVAFISHMEHHSNHISWLETIADVEIIPHDSNCNISLRGLEDLIKKYENRRFKFASITACSNVTGVIVDYHKIAKIMHKYNGYCFVDFSASAPYVDIDMCPDDSEAHLDAIFYSTHKFLGGPGSTGILIFNKSLYSASSPDNPGGGVIDWSNPWGRYKYSNCIELREDGGTPAILQTIKSALCHLLKEEMGVDNILKREEEILNCLWERLSKISNLHILHEQERNRIGIISFIIEDLHYDLGVRILNDRFGIQCRGGCSCAGTYGHYLLNIDKDQSKKITDLIDEGDFSQKPGWIRISLHPTTSTEEVNQIADAIEDLATNYKSWSTFYSQAKKQNFFLGPDFERLFPSNSSLIEKIN